MAPNDHYAVALTHDTVVARVVGLGTMNNCIRFKQFLEHSWEKDFRTFVFDLSDCAGFDSTFMGILLGFALRQCDVVVLNARVEHRKLLGEVGLDRFIEVVGRERALPDVPMRRLEEADVRPSERLRSVVEAHEELVRLGAGNREKFGPFLDALRSELSGETEER